MPKTDIDYSNTIIYKITCIDPTINDTYVGHTTNFVQRKHAHKQSCTNTRSSNYKCKLYETIRNNGGWINWKMEIINFFNCSNHYDARKKEQEYFVLLNANLNSLEPFPPRKTTNIVDIKYHCDICHVKFNSLAKLAIHDQSKKHMKRVDNVTVTQMEENVHAENTRMGLEQKNSKNLIEYYCEKCNFSASNKNDYRRHTTTRKHKAHDILTNLEHTPSTLSNNLIYKCRHCSKDYKSRNGLWYHEKKCAQQNIIEPPIENTMVYNDSIIDKDQLISYLMKENTDFKLMLMEMCRKT